MDAWLHTECGLNRMEQAQYTPQELARLQLGYLVREQQTSPQSNTSGASKQRQQIRRGQQQAREEMLDDLGFQ